MGIEVVRFSGESPWDAIVNHHGLDIVEEKEFLDFCTWRNVGKDASPEVLHRVYTIWESSKP